MRCFLLSLLCLFALPLAAQASTHACSRVAEPAARLACYDRMYPPAPETHAAATETVQTDFGLNVPTSPERIESRVLTVEHGHDGKRRFTLENGHVWTQTDANGVRVKAGDTVQVRRGTMGSYLLVAPNGVTLRVRRAR